MRRGMQSGSPAVAIRLAISMQSACHQHAIGLACSRKFASHGVDETVDSKRGILSRVACQKRVGRNVVLSTVRAISMQ